MTNPQHEPTMEEILASIRKIISEDQTEPAKPQGQAKPQAKAETRKEEPVLEAAAKAEIDVLDLTEEVQDDGPPKVIAPPPAPKPKLQEAARMTTRAEADDIAFETVEDDVDDGEGESDLISSATRDGLGHAFDDLEPDDEVPVRRRAEIPLPTGGDVEAVFERAVRQAFEPVVQGWLEGNAEAIVERMKPLVREWMDENFPPLLEDAVRREVARAARAKRGGSRRR